MMAALKLSTILLAIVLAIANGDATLKAARHFLDSTPPKVVVSSTYPSTEVHSKFQQWKEKFDREYESIKEEALRKLIWIENHAHIETHNDQLPTPSYTLGHNDFSDITNDEFKQRFFLGEYSPGIFEAKGRSDGSIFPLTSQQRKLRGPEDDVLQDDTEDDDDSDTQPVEDVPESKDWNDEGAVSPVKNQWFCGSCWAFSAVGAIEGARAIATGNLTELSVQQLIDCDKTDLGCGGGLMNNAFQYDEDSGGLCSYEAYPYALHQHWFSGCARYLPYCTPVSHSTVSKFVNVTETEDDLKAAIATQPVSVAVSAGTSDWQFYRNGVFSGGCDDEIDHGVLAVAYGHYEPALDPNAHMNATAMDYFTIKNSWGTTWGEKGFIKLGRGVGNEAEGGSSCVLKFASRPIMKKYD